MLPLLNNTQTEYSTIEQFRNAMIDGIGYTPEIIIADGKLHRIKDDSGKFNGAYTLHLDGRAAGFYQDFKQKIKIKWKAKGNFQPLSDAQRKHFAIECQRNEIKRIAEETAKHEAAGFKARYIFGQSIPAPADYLYLVKKHVKPHGLRLGRNNKLIVPIYDGTGTLVNLQFISETGGKMFLYGGKKKSCFSLVGNPNKANTDTLLICEGWATGASLHQDTGNLTVVALDAGNLEPVALVIKKLYPDSEIIICGDNDLSGVGQTAARLAALAIGGKYIIPTTPGHDFNDELSMEKSHA